MNTQYCAQYNQTAKADAGKERVTLVPGEMVRDIARLSEYDQESEAGLKPKMICKTRNVNGWKALFECPYCGESFEAYISNVTSGRQRSCGCAKGKLAVASKETHGDSKTRLYRIWRHIQERCNSETCKEYKWYGAKGIKCEFGSYEEFRDYAYAHGYNDTLTCERIDVTGNYSPGNVTFIPLQMQARNTTRSVFITYKGLTLCAAEWGEMLGVNSDTLTKRKRSGWDDARIIETPVNGSLDLSNVPLAIIPAIKAVRLYGIQKYPEGGPDNWKQVEVERYRDAAYRHLLRYLEEPHGLDEESGLPHLWHLVCNLAFICELEQLNMEIERVDQ